MKSSPFILSGTKEDLWGCVFVTAKNEAPLLLRSVDDELDELTEEVHSYIRHGKRNAYVVVIADIEEGLGLTERKDFCRSLRIACTTAGSSYINSGSSCDLFSLARFASYDPKMATILLGVSARRKKRPKQSATDQRP
jgi:hypothetical protein